jgi:predicted RNase H-like nuclease (RuvC/YqgF family)
VSADDKNRSYIDVVRDELQQYTQSLLRENEKLRAMSTALESDKRRLELEIIEARAILEQKEELRSALEEFNSTRSELMASLQNAKRERDTATQELDRLRAKFDDVEHENEKYVAQYHQIEHHSSNLSNLYVASYQLHSSVERRSVLDTIQEIVVNLIGSEEVAILETDRETGDYKMVASFGVDAARLNVANNGSGKIVKRVTAGELYINDSGSAADDELTALVPLKIEGEVIGAILVFRLLEHKQELLPVDHELFELLSVHASTALHCANLHEAAALVAVG